MKEKPILFLQNEIKTPPFADDTRILAGTLLRRLQYGEKLEMPHSKPLPNVGKQCHELRLNDSKNNIKWRIIYHITEMAIVILDIYEKKSSRIPKSIITTCQNRKRKFYKDLTEGEQYEIVFSE